MALEHPISPHWKLRGRSFESAMKVANKYKVQYDEMLWTECRVFTSEEKCPDIIVNDEAAYWLGEIGLSYILYRMRDVVDAAEARRFYRSGEMKYLSSLLANGLKRISPRYPSDKKFIFAHLDDELLSILTDYMSVSNTAVLKSVEEATMATRLNKWRWSPTGAEFFIYSKIASIGFSQGITIRNGETGHTALSIFYTLQSPSVEGMCYEFYAPITGKSRARHLPTRALQRTINQINEVLEENMLAEAFEQLGEIPGSWAHKRIDTFLREMKIPETIRDRLGIAFADLCGLSPPSTSLDTIYLFMQAGASANLTSARIAQHIINQLLMQVMEAERKVTGEVIVDAKIKEVR